MFLIMRLWMLPVILHIDAFELWCWRRILHIPWTAKKTNTWVIQKIKPDLSLEAFITRSQLSYFGHIMRRSDTLEKTVMLGKVDGSRRRGRPALRWIDSIKSYMNMSLKDLKYMVEDRNIWRQSIHAVARSRRRLDGT